MNGFSPWALLLFGSAFGACLPVAIGALTIHLRRLFFRPTLLHLDPLPVPVPTVPAGRQTEAIAVAEADASPDGGASAVVPRA
ncbi:MAG: hypothetical protein H7244_04460 [Herminiimonas sp.]|nr:hypothetical protein [Herminiimonas sp.]